MARRKLNDERRQQVIEAATKTLLERGLSETRMTDISERAGMSPGHVMYHFESKAQILVEALRYHEDRLYRRAEEEMRNIEDPWERLRKSIELQAPKRRRDEEWLLWIEVWANSSRNPDIAKHQKRLFRRWVASIAETVRYGQRLRRFADVDVDEFAARMAGLIDGLSVHITVGASSMTPAALVETCMKMARAELTP
jgi:AcrR family transcriptional regulator